MPNLKEILNADASDMMPEDFVPAPQSGKPSQWNELLDFLFQHKGRWLRWEMSDDVTRTEISKAMHAMSASAKARQMELAYRDVSPFLYLRVDVKGGE